MRPKKFKIGDTISFIHWDGTRIKDVVWRITEGRRIKGYILGKYRHLCFQERTLSLTRTVLLEKTIKWNKIQQATK